MTMFTKEEYTHLAEIADDLRARLALEKQRADRAESLVKDLKKEAIPIADWFHRVSAVLHAHARSLEKKERYVKQASKSVLSRGEAWELARTAIEEAIDLVRDIPGWNGEEHSEPSHYVLRSDLAQAQAEAAQLRAEAETDRRLPVLRAIARARDETIESASGMRGPTDRPLSGWFGLSLDDLRSWAHQDKEDKGLMFCRSCSAVSTCSSCREAFSQSKNSSRKNDSR